MKYLFFDIECANCFDGKGKICEFGYVQTDENFSIIAKESFKINPCAPFDKKGFTIRGIELEQPYEYYRMQPKFKDFYERIKNLLRLPHQVVVGHGVYNDVKYLINECERYKLPHINFEFLDTCEVAKVVYNKEKNLKLKQLYEEFCDVEDVEQKHRSLDDALMTMELAKAYSKDLNMPICQIKSKYSMASGESYIGRMIKSGVLDLLYSYEKNSTKNKELIHSFIENDLSYNANKTYVLSTEYMRDNFLAVLVILNRIKELKLLFSYELKQGATYVLNDGDNKKLQNYENYLSHKNIKANLNKISFDEFLTELGLTKEDLQITRQQADEIVGNMKCNKAWYDSYKRTHSMFYKISSQLQDKEFECSVDLPVIQFVSNIEIEKEGERRQVKYFVFYDYVLDEFYNLHPYRVNRAENSYLPSSFFKKTKEKCASRVDIELARLFNLPSGWKIINIKVVNEYPYITSYKFKGKFVENKLEFVFYNQILADDDFKGSAKSTLKDAVVNVEKSIKELYDEQDFSIALRAMSKFKFGYKSKEFIEPKIENKKYLDGDEVLLPKTYIELTENGEIDKTYIPSIINIKTELFKKDITLPVLIKRQVKENK